MAIVHDGLGDASRRISGMGKKLGLSGDGDLQQFFRSSDKTQAYYFNNFTANFPFGGWMKYKPQKLDTIPVGPPTLAQRKAANWGFINIPSWTQLSKMAGFCSEIVAFRTSANAPTCGYFEDSGNYWKYEDPTLWPSTSYRRPKDFENAWNLARPALSGRNETDSYYHPASPNGAFSVYYNPFRPASGMYGYTIELADFLGASAPFATSMYFGVMFARNASGSLRYVYKTMSTPVGTLAQNWDPLVDFSSMTSFGSVAGTLWRIFPFLSSKAYASRAYYNGDDSGVFIALPTESQMVNGRITSLSDAVFIINDGLALKINSATVSGRVLTIDYDFITIRVPTAGYYIFTWQIEGQMTPIIDQYNQQVSAGQDLSGNYTRSYTFDTTTAAQNARMVSVSVQPVPTSGTWSITQTAYTSYDI